MDTMQQFLSQTVLDIAMAAIALLAAYSINAIHKLTEKAKLETKRIQNEEERKLLTDALTDLETITTKTVTQIEQTSANTLREAVKSGTKDKSELEVLAKQAYYEIAEALKPEYKTVIENNFGSFSKYLTKAIESKVFDLKNSVS